MKKPRVLLADDHRILAEGVRGLLESEFELVGIVSDGRELVEAAIKLRPDVVVADISMPSLNGIDAVAQTPGASYVQGRLLNHATRHLLRTEGDGGRGIRIRPETFRPRRTDQGDTGSTPRPDLRDPADCRGTSPLLSRRGPATPGRGPSIDTSPTRSIAALRPGPVREGGRETPTNLHADSGISSGLAS